MNLDAVFSEALQDGPAPLKRPGPGNGGISSECATTLTQPPTRLFTLAEARRILDDPVRDMAYLDTTLGPHVAAYLRWYRAGGPRPKGVDSKERELARLAIQLPPGVGVADVSTEHLLLVLDVIPEGSWKKVRSHWKTFFDWAIEWDLRPAKNPVTRLPKLLPRTEAPDTTKVFTQGERDLLVQAARFMDDPVRDRARALLLLDSGIRKAEARGIRVWDIDPVDRVVTVTGKGNPPKVRVVPISGPFWLAWEHALLEEVPRLGRQYRPDDYVWFPTRVAGEYKGRARQVLAVYPDRPMSERGFHEWWARLAGHAGIPYRKLHTTRHTYATAALDASEGDIYGVKELLGHASTATTELYLHSSMKRKRSVADKLARARRASEETTG